MRWKTLSITVILVLIISSALVVIISDDSDSRSKSITLNPDQYKCRDNSGYRPSNYESMDFLKDYSYVTISSSGNRIERTSSEGHTAITTDGNINININYRVNNIKEGIMLKDGWFLSDDTANSIDGVSTGKIGIGGLLVQKSSSPYYWPSNDYIVYNTGCKETQPLTLTTGDIGEGAYIRILVAYELYQKSWFFKIATNHCNIIEEYIFYVNICNPGAIVLKNLSNGDDIEEIDSFRTMEDGSLTTTGFSIGNLTSSGAKCAVYHNGDPIEASLNRSYTDPGRYDIKLFSPIDTAFEYHWTLYVASVDNVLQELFGDEFLCEDYCVYNPNYNVPSYKLGVSTEFKQSDMAPIFRLTVFNITENYKEEYNNQFTRTIKYSPGLYNVLLSNSMSNNTGDIITILYSFNIEEGDYVWNPQTNHDLIMKSSYPIDFCPYYYGYESDAQGIGKIIWMFKDYESAWEFGMSFEYSMTEKDGTNYIWKNKSYTNTWELTESIGNYVEQKTNMKFIDPNDPNTYRAVALPDSELSVKDLSNLNLPMDVHLFGSELEKQLLKRDIPLISQKEFSILTEGREYRYRDQSTLVTDIHKLESNTATVHIIDSDDYFTVEYNVGLVDQLVKMNVNPGYLEIIETSSAGTTSYQALYLPPNYCSIEGIIDMIDSNGTSSTDHFDKTSVSNHYICSKFKISEVNEVYGDSIVKLNYGGFTQYYTITEIENMVFETQGSYQVQFINCLGNTIELNVVVIG